MNTASQHSLHLAPSPWIERFAHLVPAGVRVLDVAAGSGRHALYFAARGNRVLAVDREGLGSQSATLQVVINPLVDWIWLGFGVLALGTGIALLPEWMLEDRIARGALRALLPEWESAPVRVFALHRTELRGAQRVRAFVDHLLACWSPDARAA